MSNFVIKAVAVDGMALSSARELQEHWDLYVHVYGTSTQVWLSQLEPCLSKDFPFEMMYGNEQKQYC